MNEFLTRVWGEQAGYGFVPSRGNRWREVYVEWPGQVELTLEEDCYFSVQLFSVPQRIKQNALPSRWLYADLDAVNPRKLPFKPTIAIQTSPGRYQALWELKRSLQPRSLETLNQRLTYTTGADKGGWHLGKVLRIPGTYNYKYGKNQVRLLWDNHQRYTKKEVEDYVKGVEAFEVDTEVKGLTLPAESRDSILKRNWDRLDDRSKALLNERAEQPAGERSDRLWELECRLLERGLEPEEVFLVVRETVWNKFGERRSGDIQLWAEVRKAHLHIGTSVSEGSDSSGPVRVRPRIVSFADLLGAKLSEPSWLIEDWWTMGSHGVIAGLPKSYKSLVSLDMAVSIASSTPFLNLFDVNPHGSGPVLIIQQENSLPLLRDRLWKITEARGLFRGKASAGEKDNSIVVEFPPGIPVLFYNDFAFDMTMPEDRDSIEEIIQKEGCKLVVFDPLYLMIGGADENNAKEMRPILSWLLRLRNLYNCAVVVVHHWGKGTIGRGGRGTGGIRLLGSTTIYGWLEAALYLEAKQIEDSYQVVVEREFRERLSPPPTGLLLNMGDVGHSRYEWIKRGAIGTSNRVLWAIKNAPEGITQAEIRGALGEDSMGQKKLRAELADLLETGTIRVETEGRLKRFYYEG